MSHVFKWRYLLTTLDLQKLIIITLLAPTLYADDSDLQLDSYTKLYYRHTIRDVNRRMQTEVVQHRLPFFDENDAIQANQRESICQNAGQIIAVHENELYSRGPLYGIVVINIETGESQELIKHQQVVKYNAQRNELLMLPALGGRVQRYDLSDKTFELIFQADPYRSRPGRTHNRMALSPDGQQLALISFSPKNAEDSSSTRFHLDIIDLDAEEASSKTLSNEVHGKIVLTGGSDHVVGPPLVWKDEQTVILLSSTPPEPQGVIGNIIIFDDGPTQSQIIAFDVKTGEERKVCEVKPVPQQLHSRIFDHHLWERADGEVMLSTIDGSDFRIDFDKGKLTDDSHLSKHYEFRKINNSGTLLYHGRILAEGVKESEVSLTPDGCAIVWIESQQQQQQQQQPNRFPNPNAERSLYYHSLTSGQHELAKGIFRNDIGSSANRPTENRMFLWSK